MKKSAVVPDDDEVGGAWVENDFGGFLNEMFDESLLVWETENSLMSSRAPEHKDPRATPTAYEQPMEPITPQDLTSESESEQFVAASPSLMLDHHTGSVVSEPSRSVDIHGPFSTSAEYEADAAFSDSSSPPLEIAEGHLAEAPSSTSNVEGSRVDRMDRSNRSSAQSSRNETRARETFLKAVASAKTSTDSCHHPSTTSYPPLSEHDRAVRRRERNRILAKETRLRKKHNFASLQSQFAKLHEENQRLQDIVKSHIQPDAVRQGILKDATKGLEEIPQEVWDSFGSPRLGAPKEDKKKTCNSGAVDERSSSASCNRSSMGKKQLAPTAAKNQKRKSSLCSTKSDCKNTVSHLTNTRRRVSVVESPSQQQNPVAVVTPPMKKQKTVEVFLLPTPSSVSSSSNIAFPFPH